MEPLNYGEEDPAGDGADISEDIHSSFTPFIDLAPWHPALLKAMHQDKATRAKFKQLAEDVSVGCSTSRTSYSLTKLVWGNPLFAF